MQTVGEILKKTRLEKKLTLEAIEEKTKIKKEYLLALENNHYQKLPSMAYAQGFIKSYSQALNLKPAPLLAVFRRDYKETPPPFFHSSSPNKAYWTPKLTIITFIALIVFLFLCYLCWQYRLLIKSPYWFYNK